MGKKNDNYETPQYLANWAVNHALELSGTSGESCSLLEPGCGAKAPFARVGIEHGCSVVAVENRPVLNVGLTPWPLPINDSRKHSFLMEKDFLTDQGDWTERKYKIIAANPPFSKALSFLERSFELLHPFGVMIYLLRLSFLSSKSRVQLFSERPPHEVHILQRRPSFSYDGKTDMSEYAFYVWLGEGHSKILKEHNGSSITYLKWLNNWKLEKEV